MDISPEIAALIDSIQDLERAKKWLKDLYSTLTQEIPEMGEYIEPTELW